MQTSSKQLKIQLLSAAVMALLSLFALSVATYAWYVSNHEVKATTSTISAKANNFVLQIATLNEGAQHGKNQSFVAVTDGHKISPASTSDLKNWYVCQGWGQDGKVYGYSKLDSLKPDGEYAADTVHYAYIKSEYVLYTITETGYCDAYLDGSDENGAIEVRANGSATSNVVPDSMRVGITIQNLDGKTPSGDEKLIAVYAPKEETGKGNDATAVDGWTCVKDESSLMSVTYPHIAEKNYVWTDTDGTEHNFAANKTGDNYVAPTENAAPIASRIDYDGVIMRVYIWLEGTDADCINNSNQDDPSTYNVTVNLAGVAAS